MNLPAVVRAVCWAVGLLAPVVMSLVLQVGIAAEPKVVAPADAPEPAEPPRFRPHVSLDRDTGLLTYSVINVADEPIDVHLTTINGDDFNNTGWREGRRQTAGGINMLYDIGIDGEEYAPIEDTSDGEGCVLLAEMEDVRWKICRLVDEKYVLQQLWPGAAPVAQKRVATLLPGEGLSRSLILQDQPWYDDVVAILEDCGLTKFRINPRADVYVVKKNGLIAEDSGSSRVYGDHYFPGDDDHAAIYPLPGVKFDLKFARKLQGMKTKAAASQRDAPAVQPGDSAPAVKSGD
jgi:hypothetical protein